MKTYMVTLISRDSQRFQSVEEALTDDNAVNKALIKIKEKGWDCYEYKLYQLERLK